MTTVSEAADVRVRTRLTDWPVWVLTLGTFITYAGYALLQHRRFATAGYDLGIFDQAVRRYAHFQAPIVPIKGVGFNVWGDHFHPIIALGAPLYWLWDDPRTLLILQAALIAVSVPVVYRFARRRTSAGPALAVCFAYAAGWPFQAMVDFQFHEVAWGVPLLALAIDALDRGNNRQLLIFAGLLLLVREDMGILVVLLGLLRALRRPRVWRGGLGVGVGMMVAGVVAYELTTAVILPHFSPNGQYAYWQYTETLGPDLPSALRHIVTQPWDTIRLFFSPGTKTQTLLLLLLPLLLLSLRSPYALLALPLLAQRFFEPPVRSNLWFPSYHYNALPWVVLVLAMIDGAGRLGIWSRPRWTQVVSAAVAVIPIVLIAVNPHFSGRGVAPLHNLVTGQRFHVDKHMKAQQALIDRVPSNVCVEADDRLAGHLTSRDYVTLPPLQHHTADFVALDLTQPDIGDFGPTPDAILADARAAGYTPIFAEDGVVLLLSPKFTAPSSSCGPLGVGHPGAAG